MLHLFILLALHGLAWAAPSSGDCLCVNANRVNVRDSGK